MLVVGSEQEVRHQVQEDKDTGTCAESNMYTALFDTEAFAHWTLDVEAIVLVFSTLEHTRSPDNIGVIDILQDKVFLIRNSSPRALN